MITGASKKALPTTIVVPDNAPQTKLQAIELLGGKIIKVPYSEWWNVMMTRKFNDANGVFIHPVCEREVMAGTCILHWHS